MSMAGKVVHLDASEVPLPTDEAMSAKSHGKRLAEGGTPSPTRQRGAGDSVTVDVETLRGLLAEQTATLMDRVMQGQKEQLASLATELRTEFRQGEEEVKQEVKIQRQSIQELQQDNKHMAARIAKLEQHQGSSSGASTAEPISLERHRFTLIFGGWSKDTSRQTITSQLHKALQELNLASATDFPGFTTGPRRSVALMQFRIRSPHEDYQGMRDRMQMVSGGINRSTVIVKGGGKMWSGFSKPKPERDRGAHAALVRRCVRALDPAREGELEAEYGSGSTWLSDFKFSSGSTMAEGDDKTHLMELDPLVPGGIHPWIDVGAMAECFRVKEQKIREVIKENLRR